MSLSLSLSLSLLAGASLSASNGACVPVPPPASSSVEAQAILSTIEDRRFLPEDLATTEDWVRLQRLSREAGERWIAAQVETGKIAVEWTELGGVRAAWVRPIAEPEGEDDLIVFNLHGGGYALNGGEAALYSAVSFAELEGLTSVSVDYRLTPQHPWPAALDDAVAAYRALIETYPSAQIAVYGLSAGGGLGAAFLLKLRDLGIEPPGAAVLNSPWSDVSLQGDTLATLDCHDILLGRSLPAIRQLADFYSGSSDSSDPLISPLNADWSGIEVPVLLVSGTRDIMLSDTARLHLVMKHAGVPAELIVYEGMWHAFSVDPEFERMINDSVRSMRLSWNRTISSE